MTKKRKALQISALLTAVSGATMLMSASDPAFAAPVLNNIDQNCCPAQGSTDPRCQNPVQPPSEEIRLHGCAFIEYGLTPNNRIPGGDGGGAGGGGGGGGGGPEPGPRPPYTS